jgi:hypothetical protein
MKTILAGCALLVAVLLVVFSGQHSNSQVYQKVLANETKMGIDPEQKKEFLKLLVPELLNDREFKRELIREIAQSMGPETMKEVADSIASECAKDPQFRKEILRLVMSSATSQLRELFASANHGSRSPNQAMLMSLISGVASRGISGGRAQPLENGSRYPGDRGRTESLDLSTDFVNVFVNPENRMRSLTANEARKLFTGELTNWSQLGGPDLAIEVVTWNDATSEIEHVVGKRVSREAVRLRYLSLIIPAVSRSRGAIAFLPATLVAELPFMERHEAMRNVFITTDKNAGSETVPRKNGEDVVRQTDSGNQKQNLASPVLTLITR